MKPLFLACAVLALSAPVSAAPHGIIWAPGAGPTRTQDASVPGPRLLYYGGPVISRAKVYAVFWGKNVNAETRAHIGDFFKDMLDSSYMDWLSEYHTDRNAVDGRHGTSQTIGRGTFGGSFTIVPSNPSENLTDAMVQRELESQIDAGKLPRADENTLYMTYFPQGTRITIEGMRSCSSFCAYHEGFRSRNGTGIYYGVMPECFGGCGVPGSALDGMTSVSSHEAIEAITDPFPTPGDKPAYPQAWNSAQGDEITDLCQSGNSKLGPWTVQAQWKNSINACYSGPWTPGPALAAGR